MADSYPVMLHLEGRICMVIGGGKVAARKVSGLLAAGTTVIVISPLVCPELQTLADEGNITVRFTRYIPGTLAEVRPMLVFVATDDRAVNEQIAEEARTLGILVNRADSGDEGDFENVAAIRRGSITVAISTDGAAPALAKHLGEQIAGSIGEEYVILAAWMAAHRLAVQAAIHSQSERAALWRKIVDAPILDELRQGHTEAAQVLFNEIVSEAMGDQS